MKFCKKCLAPDTHPGIEFDAAGVCMGCVYAGQVKDEIDWGRRQKELRDIAQWAKEHNHGGWDCAIGVSGGKDSTFQALYAKETMGLNCLLVNCAPDKITDVGRANLENLVTHGFDLVSWRNNPLVMRALTKRSFYEYGNPVKPSEYPLFAVTYQTALAYRIPLIIQGENPGLTLGCTKGFGTDGDAFGLVMGNTVRGGNASDWVGDGIEMKDLLLYQFPGRETLTRAGIRAIYLQYYVKEWSPEHNTGFAVKHGLCGREDLPYRLNRYASVDSNMQLLNPLIKFYKFGYSNLTDSVNHRIRQGIMTREEGLELVRKWDGYCDERYIRDFCDYIGITVAEFWRELEAKWINRRLFRKTPDGKWERRYTPGVDFDESTA